MLYIFIILLISAISLSAAQNNAQTDALIEAVKANNLSMVERVIEKGVSPLEKNKKGLSAFYIAIIQGKTEIAKYFLEKLNVKGEFLNSNKELMTAIQGEHVEVVKFLLDNGAFLGRKIMLKGFYPLAFAKIEMDGKGKAHDAKAKEIVSLIFKKHQELNCQLIEAVQNSNKMEEVRSLLKRGASPLSKNSTGKSALDIALLQYKDILTKRCKKLDKKLIETVKDTQIVRTAASLHNLILLGACPKNPYVIFLAAFNNKEDLIEVLIENGADIDQKDPTNGLTALHEAIIAKNEMAASIILKYGADPFIKEDKKKQDVLSALSTNQFEHFISDDMSEIINLSEGMKKILQRAVLLRRASTGLKVAGALSALTFLCCAWYESKDSKDKQSLTEEKNSLRKFFALLKRKKKTVAFALGTVAFFLADGFGVKALRTRIFSS